MNEEEVGKIVVGDRWRFTKYPRGGVYRILRFVTNAITFQEMVLYIGEGSHDDGNAYVTTPWEFLTSFTLVERRKKEEPPEKVAGHLSQEGKSWGLK